MNNKTRKILAWIAFIIGSIIIIFFEKYQGDVIPYPFLIWSLGILFYIIGIILLIKTKNRKDDNIIKATKNYIQNLKHAGDKIIVQLNDCEIKQNSYYETTNYYEKLTDAEIMLLPAYIHVYGEVKNNKKQNFINQSVAVYKVNYKGKETTFISPIISKDKTTILFKFDFQKNTMIYIDKNDSSKYYFDIDFIYN